MLDNAVTMRPGAAAGKLQDSEDNVRRIRGHGAHMGTWVGAGVSPRSELCHDGWSPYMSLHLKWDPFSLHIKLDPVASMSTFICTFLKTEITDRKNRISCIRLFYQWENIFFNAFRF